MALIQEDKMCALCTGVPTVLTLGLAAETKQRQACRAAAENGEPEPRKRPFIALTAAGVLGLVLTSVLYHTQLNGI